MRDDDIFLHFERESRRKHKRVRQILYEEGRPDLVADLDAKMRDIQTGKYGAQSTWHSISPAQRRTMIELHESGKSNARKKTIAALIRRDLVDDHGLTERGRFVLAHGR